MRRLSFAGAALLAAGLIGTAQAAPFTQTSVVPGRALGPVALGDERVPVEALLGPGTVINRRPNRDIPSLWTEVVAYPRFGIEVTFPTEEASSGATRIRSTWARYRTARGIGVGSSRREVLLAYPRARCRPTVCTLASRVGTARVETRFVVPGERVTRVTLIRG